MRRRRHDRKLIAAIIPWSGIALTALASTECWVIENRPCITAGVACTYSGSTGTIQANGGSGFQCTKGSPGNLTCTNKAQSDCVYVCVVTVNGQAQNHTLTARVGSDPLLEGASC